MTMGKKWTGAVLLIGVAYLAGVMIWAQPHSVEVMDVKIGDLQRRIEVVERANLSDRMTRLEVAMEGIRTAAESQNKILMAILCPLLVLVIERAVMIGKGRRKVETTND